MGHHYQNEKGNKTSHAATPISVVKRHRTNTATVANRKLACVTHPTARDSHDRASRQQNTLFIRLPLTHAFHTYSPTLPPPRSTRTPSTPAHEREIFVPLSRLPSRPQKSLFFASNRDLKMVKVASSLGQRWCVLCEIQD